MNLYETFVNKFGTTHQLLKMVEEITELARADNDKDRKQVIEEIVDVFIMKLQLKYIVRNLKKKYNISNTELKNYHNIKLKKIEELYLNNEN